MSQNITQTSLLNPVFPLPPYGFARQLTDLGKLYIDRDSDFGAELYDILSIKLLIFYDFYGNFGLKEEQYHSVFSSLLRDCANQFYYDHMVNKGYEFRKMVKLTSSYFETEANKQDYLTL